MRTFCTQTSRPAVHALEGLHDGYKVPYEEGCIASSCVLLHKSADGRRKEK